MGVATVAAALAATVVYVTWPSTTCGTEPKRRSAAVENTAGETVTLLTLLRVTANSVTATVLNQKRVRE